MSSCPLTGSGIVSDPILNGQLHNCGVSGLLFDNNLIMFDRTTDSFWSQMRLDSICGDFSGTRPPLLPIVQSIWAVWEAMHPTTTAVSFDTGFSRDYNRYPYGDYDRVDNAQLLFPQTTIDPRLPTKENVLGVTHGGLSRAYSMTRMGSVAARGEINDVGHGLSVLVVFDGPSKLAIPFDRTRESGEVLTFQLAEDAGFPFSRRDHGERKRERRGEDRIGCPEAPPVLLGRQQEDGHDEEQDLTERNFRNDEGSEPRSLLREKCDRCEKRRRQYPHSIH